MINEMYSINVKRNGTEYTGNIFRMNEKATDLEELFSAEISGKRGASYVLIAWANGTYRIFSFKKSTSYEGRTKDLQIEMNIPTVTAQA